MPITRKKTPLSKSKSTKQSKPQSTKLSKPPAKPLVKPPIKLQETPQTTLQTTSLRSGVQSKSGKRPSLSPTLNALHASIRKDFSMASVPKIPTFDPQAVAAQAALA